MPVDTGSFTKTILHPQSGEPVALAVLPDGRVLHTVRGGRVWLHGLDGTNSVAADIPVYSHDGAGNLYLSTGDDTNPGLSDGYTPIDERPERNPGVDAQRSAANTADLRGKILRIRVASDGTYTIPEGNLFPPGTAGTRPEIYAMGLRNPYRFAVNRVTNEVYVADYAPDQGMASATRGPAATGKWLVVRRAANYGWPYCIGHLAYVDYDFATETSGAPFDCDNPRNESPRNTGLVDLPPVTDPELVYNYGSTANYPGLGSGGIGPMAGPMYVFDPASTSPIKWPERYSGGIVFTSGPVISSPCSGSAMMVP